MKVSDAVAQVLAENNVVVGFELIGGMITHLVDSITNLGATKLVSMHHEQGGAFAAAAIARGTKNQKLGVALGTSGPGATNLITGIADCWLDSVPCIFLTGQVNRSELKGSLPVRQQGFQELDIVCLVESITKYAVQVTDSSQVIYELKKAINIALEGRPGPVLLDIPMDIQSAEINEALVEDPTIHKENKLQVEAIDEAAIYHVLEAFSASKKPLVLIGGGAVNAKSYGDWLNNIIESKVPHVASLKGAEKTKNSKYYLGMLGTYGCRAANYAVQNCDLLLVLGSRLDVRQTGAKPQDFAPKAKIIQIDIDSAQLDNRVAAKSFCLNLEKFFADSLENRLHTSDEWLREVFNKKQKMYFDEYLDWLISPFSLFETLNNVFYDKALDYVADVGNNQMWAAHSLRLTEQQSSHYSGGLGSMGFALPSGIGLSYATTKPVVVITGDGGLQLNIQELDIIAREQLPILVLLFNNKTLGMVRNFQELYFGGRNSSTYWNGYSCDFQNIAKGYHIESYRVETITQFEKLVTCFCDSPKPMFIEVVMCDAKECRPRLEFGNTLENQAPHVITE